MWLNFVGGPQLGLTEVIVAGMFVMLLTLFLLAITMVIDDPAGGLRKSSSFGTTMTAIIGATRSWRGSVCSIPEA
jgi:hypothetical protein